MVHFSEPSVKNSEERNSLRAPMPRIGQLFRYDLSSRACDKQSIPQCTAPGGSNEQSITRQSLQPSSLYGQLATTTRASHCRCEQNTFCG
jgi:hypothetical protein